MTEYHNRFLNKVIECYERGDFFPTWRELPDVISKFSRTEYAAMSDFITSVCATVTNKLRAETDYNDVQLVWRYTSFILYIDSYVENGCKNGEMYQFFQDLVGHLYEGIYECACDCTLENRVWLHNKLTAFDAMVTKQYEVAVYTLRYYLSELLRGKD